VGIEIASFAVIRFDIEVKDSGFLDFGEDPCTFLRYRSIFGDDVTT
jgi:hypothetical protein